MSQASFDFLIEQNKSYCDHYKNTDLIRLVNSNELQQTETRERLLDCIQIFSDYFQKTIMLRNVFCDNPKFLALTQQHLKEEFGHNIDLMQEREFRAPVWDPILEATSAWFAWKMLTLDSEEKIVLIHLVLETSANIFFQNAYNVMNKNKKSDYFTLHAEVDEDHEKIGVEFLQNLSVEKYKRLLEVQQQGWRILNTVSDQIASLTMVV